MSRAKTDEALRLEAIRVGTDMQESQLYSSNFSNATMSGTRIRFAIFQDAVMDGCKGCPHDW